jgi:hypothetical protein
VAPLAPMHRAAGYHHAAAIGSTYSPRVAAPLQRPVQKCLLAGYLPAHATLP